MTSSVSQPYLSMGFLGPTFKADTKSAAIWTPSSRRTLSKSDEPSSYVGQQFSRPPSSTSSSNYYAPDNFQPVYFSPAPASVTPSVSISAPYQDQNQTTGQSQLILTPQKSPAPIFAPPPPPPLSAPAKTATASPPPLSDQTPKKWSTVNTKYSHLTPEEAAIAADPNRSVIEYPEKQTVAALRNKIETKLNGSIPVKGYSMMPHMEIYAVKPQVQPQTQPQPPPVRPQPKPQPASDKANVIASVSQQPQPTTDQISDAASADEINVKSIEIEVKDKMDLVNMAVEDLKNAVFGAKTAATTTLESPKLKDEQLQAVILAEEFEDSGLTKVAPDKVRGAEPSQTFRNDIYSTPSAPISKEERRVKSETISSIATSRTQDIKSPTPPQVPPPPARYTPLSVSVDTSESSVNFIRPSDFRSGTYFDNSYVIRTSRSPPRNATLVDQKTTVDGQGRLQTEKYFTVPYQQTVSSRRFLSQSEDDRRIPEGFGQNIDDKENQHQWYKTMYKKLHHVDKREEESVLRYQMRDFLGEKYSTESLAHRRRTDEENNPYVVTYKFADYLNEPDMSYERGYVPQPAYIANTLPGKGARRTAEKEIYARTTRSKSASRFDSSGLMSPPLSTDVVRASTPGERYKHQPKKIEDYIPGTSSVADYEHEKQRTIAASTRPQSSMAYAAGGPPGRIFGTAEASPSTASCQRRNEIISPVPRAEARQWYKNVQSGGDVPLGGLSQLAPERIDSPSSQIYADSNQIRNSKTQNSSNNGAEKLPLEIEELGRLEKELVLEAERRKKFERELSDQRSRRHGYIPVQIKTPMIGDNRFEKLISDYGSRGRAPAPTSPTTSDFRGVARALYAFTAHSPRELTFFKGDLIKIRGIIDENWFEGELKGRVGIVPSNYVELVAAAEGEERVMLTEVSKKREGQAQALFNFEGRRMNELPLCKGEVIRLTRKIDDHWYEGRNDLGRRGIFPSNYVRVFNEPSSQLKDYVSAFDANNPPTYDSSLPGNEFRLQINGVQYDKNEPGDPYARKAPLTSTPSAFKSLDFRASNSSPRYPKTDFTRLNQMSTNYDAYRTVFPYAPQNEDELALQEGDIVYVIEKCDDGWFIGTSLRTGKFGTFPGNYVKLM